MRLGKLDIDRPLVLAPMEDVTDPPFRALCKDQGCDLFYTEFANCEAVIRNVKSENRKLDVSGGVRPIGTQLYGSNPESMARAAEMAAAHQPDFIDINAGCWVKKIAKRGDGAGLLRDLPKFEAVVKAVVGATDLPVTVKTRLGWDGDSIVILEAARMLEQCGIAALALHCRTRQQAYTGEADWSWLPKVRGVISIPLIGNGDVTTPQDAKAMFELGCDGVMIGRGVINNPWLFAHAKHYLATGETLPAPSVAERVGMCIRHLSGSVAYRGMRKGVLSFRKHYSGYLKGVRGIARLRAELMEYTELEPIIERLHRFVAEYEAEEALEEGVDPCSKH